MSEYVVSARKYRPQTFEEVVGQEHVTKTLYNEIKTDHLAQAFLFCGPRGVGKTTCARILAKEINKDSIEDKNYDYSFNIFELDAASNNSVEDIRMLNEQVRIPPQVGQYKVYIIDEVHMLSAAAFNAFLKTLEEPPSYAVFILATTERHKILPTILSRCQIFNFNRISVDKIVNHLKQIVEKEGAKAEEEALHVIAQKADGALRDALSIFDQMLSIGEINAISYDDVLNHLNVLDRDIYFQLSDAFQNQDISQVLLTFDKVLDKGFDAQIFLNGLANHFRDIMVSRDPRTAELLEVSSSIKSKYMDTASAMDQGFLVNAIQILNAADLSYKASRNQRLHVELALIKLCYLPALVSNDEKKNRKAKLNPASGKKSQEKTSISSAEDQSPDSENDSEFGADKEQKKVVERAAIPDTLEPQSQSFKFRSDQNFEGLNKKNPSIASLSALNEIVGDEPKNDEESEEVDEVTDDRVITTDLLQKAYSEYREEISTSGKRLASLLNIIEPEIVEGRLEFKATSSHIIQLEEIKSDLLQDLRKRLSSKKIEIVLTEIEHVVEGPRAYTDSDKYEAMVKKNPLIKDLRDSLDLDFD